MNFDDEVKIIERHLGEGLVAQDAGVVDQNVNAALFVHRLPDQVFYLRVVGNVGAVADCLSTRRLDLRDYGVRIGGLAVLITDVIYDNFRTALSECQRVTPTQTLASSCDNGYLAI